MLRVKQGAGWHAVVSWKQIPLWPPGLSRSAPQTLVNYLVIYCGIPCVPSSYQGWECPSIRLSGSQHYVYGSSPRCCRPRQELPSDKGRCACCHGQAVRPVANTIRAFCCTIRLKTRFIQVPTPCSLRNCRSSIFLPPTLAGEHVTLERVRPVALRVSAYGCVDKARCFLVSPVHGYDNVT